MQSVPFSMVMAEDLYQGLEAAADKRRCSKSYIVKLALYAWLEQNEHVSPHDQPRLKGKHERRLAKALAHMEESMKVLREQEREEAEEDDEQI